MASESDNKGKLRFATRDEEREFEPGGPPAARGSVTKQRERRDSHGSDISDSSFVSMSASRASSFTEVETDDDRDEVSGKWWQCGLCAPIDAEERAKRMAQRQMLLKQREDEERKIRDLAAATDVKKPFYFKISEITASFEAKLDNAFIEIVMGGKTAERRSADAVEKTVIRKRKDKDGNEVEVEIKVREYKKKTQIVAPPAARYFSRKRRGIKIRTPVSFAMHEFEGEWFGSYDDLEEETLLLRFWNHSSSGPNRLIGTASEKLIAIANDKVDREVVVENTNEGGRKTITAITSYKCVLQENFNFQMDFADWEAMFQDEDEQVETDDEQEFIYAANTRQKKERDAEIAEKNRIRELERRRARLKQKKHVLKFELSNPRHSMMDSVMMALTQCKWSSDLSGSLRLTNGASERDRSSIRYSGTRAWLEDEELMITLYKLSGPLDMIETKIASKATTLQGVLDHGYVLVHMDYEEGWGPKGKIPLHVIEKKKQREARRLAEIERKKNRKKNRKKKKKKSGCGKCFSCLSCLPCCKEESDEEDEETKRRRRRRERRKRGEPSESDTDSEKDTDDQQKLQVKGVINAMTQPLYRQLGNVGRATGPSKWFQLSKGEVYLVVKIIRAKGLTSLDEFKENLNPSVMVEWGGVRKVTRTVFGNNEPFWDDDLYFKIPDVAAFPPDVIEDFGPVARNSSLVLSIWDNEGITKSPLGHTEVGFDSLYQYRTEKRVESTRNKGRYLKLWVYEAKKPLTIPSTHVKEGDHMDRGKKKGGKGKKGDDDDDDDDEDEDDGSGLPGAQGASKNISQYIEFYCYFDQGESARKVDRPKITDSIQSGKPDDPRNPFGVKENAICDPTPLFAAEQLRGRSYWDESLKMVPAFEQRYFAFMGKDQYSGWLHFLPTFVKPMHPPTEIQDLDRLFYFIHSIEYQSKPVIDHDELPRLSLIRRMPHTWVWCDPFFFLEKKKGDIKDHALLLCNFLLGLNLDAWICVGTARGRHAGGRGQQPQSHVWVMTRHNLDQDDAKKNNDDDNNNPNKKKKHKGKDAWRNDRYVFFWEILNNKIFPITGQYLFEDDPVPRNPFIARGAEDAFMHIEDEDEKLDAIDQHITELTVEPEDMDPADKFYNDVQDEQRESRIAVTREMKTEQRDIITPLRLDNVEQKRGHEPQTPYITLDVVFNDEKLYANLQAPNPEVIKYDFHNPNRWRKFEKRIWSEFVNTSKLTPFYNDKSMNSMPVQEAEAESIQEEICERVRGTIRAHREYEFHVETAFYDEFPFPSGAKPAAEFIMKRLTFEEQSVRSEELKNLTDDMGDEADDELVRLSPKQLDREREKWRNKILNALDNKSRFTEKILHFKHADGNRIADSVVEQCSSAFPINMLQLKTSQDPVYAVGVKLERLPSMVSPVRVYIGVTYLAGKQE